MRCEAKHLCSPSRVFFFLMRCEAKHSCGPSRVFFFFFYFYLLDVFRTHQNGHFLSQWSRERNVRKRSFKRESTVSRSNQNHLGFNHSWKPPFAHKQRPKTMILTEFCLEIIKSTADIEWWIIEEINQAIKNLYEKEIIKSICLRDMYLSFDGGSMPINSSMSTSIHSRFSDFSNILLRTAFRIRVQLEYHLVFF